ncbi:MAG TPA: DUF167 domain-containing protein [Gemmatimonadales bacterium]
MASITVHVVARASRTAVAGMHGDAIRIRVAAPPVDGAANAELVRFLAERLGVRRQDVTIKSGGASRRKVVTISGLGSGDATRRLLSR